MLSMGERARGCGSGKELAERPDCARAIRRCVLVATLTRACEQPVSLWKSMERKGIEPSTSALRTRRSPN